MLPRDLRLPRSDFQKVAQGIRASSKHFSVTFRARGVGGCAAIVTTKTAKHSVDRHLLKRRIFAVMWPYCRKEGAFIVYARAGAPALSFALLKQELLDVLEQLRSK